MTKNNLQVCRVPGTNITLYINCNRKIKRKRKEKKSKFKDDMISWGTLR